MDFTNKNQIEGHISNRVNNTNAHLEAPPQRNEDNFPILTCLKEGYKLWHGFLNRLPRATRYTLGAKIDNIFTDTIAIALTAKYTKQTEKVIKLKQISENLDYLKYFLTILWEVKGIDNNKFAELGSKLATAGKMTGGLIKFIK